MIITVTLNPCFDRTLDVPGFRVGQHAKARLLALVPAGKGVNVAKGVAKLGGEIGACILIGHGEAQAFRDSFAAQGVECAACEVAGVTRTNTTVLDPAGHTTTHLREHGFTVSSRDLAALRGTLLDLVGAHRARREQVTLVFAGSLPPGLEPADFAGLLADARGAGATVVVDTSGEALRAAVQAGCLDTIKPNLLELGQCLGRDLDARDGPVGASELLGRVGRVLLTLGEGGAWVIENDFRIGMKCPLPAAEQRNSVGAGDAFLAGWLYGWSRFGERATALRWAVAAGAACLRSETSVDYRVEDVRAMLERCEPI